MGDGLFFPILRLFTPNPWDKKKKVCRDFDWTGGKPGLLVLISLVHLSVEVSGINFYVVISIVMINGYGLGYNIHATNCMGSRGTNFSAVLAKVPMHDRNLWFDRLHWFAVNDDDDDDNDDDEHFYGDDFFDGGGDNDDDDIDDEDDVDDDDDNDDDDDDDDFTDDDNCIDDGDDCDKDV